MKMKKRFLSILLSLVMVLGLMPGMSMRARSATTPGIYTVSFNGKNEQSTEGYFTFGNKHTFNAKFNNASYDDISFSSGLKMEGATKVSFTTTAESTVTIVQSTWSDKTIKFDSNVLSVDEAAVGEGCRIYTVSSVAAGDHEITRGSGESGLFYVKVEYAETNAAVPYLTWDATEKKLVEQTGDNACTSYTLVNAENQSNYDFSGVNVGSGVTTGNFTWLVIEGNVIFQNRIGVDGTANLILKDGATLTANRGITVSAGNTLNIYAQSTGTDMGILSAKVNSYYNDAGIGSLTEAGAGGEVNIYGGNVIAKGGDNAAGIGGGNSGKGGTVTIYGGTVETNGGDYGSGIGGGYNGAGGTVTIYGGVIRANGNRYAAGIGGGYNGAGGTVTIYGGDVTVTSYSMGAGIGGGYGESNGCNGGDVAIYGGTVTSTSGSYGSNGAKGIGGGDGAIAHGTLTIGEGMYLYGGSALSDAGHVKQENNDYARSRYMLVCDTEPPHAIVLDFNGETITGLTEISVIVKDNYNDLLEIYTSMMTSVAPAGKMFAGWYEKENGVLKDEAFDFSTIDPDSMTADITIYAKWVDKPLTIKIEENENGSVSVEPTGEKKSGDRVTLKVMSDAGYQLVDNSLKVIGGYDESVETETLKTAVVYSLDEAIAALPDVATVLFADAELAVVQKDALLDKKNDTLEWQYFGYSEGEIENGSWVYTGLYMGYGVFVDAKAMQVALSSGQEAGTYTFTMPNSSVRVSAEFIGHTHSFTYSAGGATITATCSAEDCPLTESKATLTIGAPTMTVYQETGKSEVASLTGLQDFNTATGKSLAVTNIMYVGRDGTEYTESTTAPTNAGKYTATITLSGVKTAEGDDKSVAASVDYSIKYAVTFNTNGGSAVPQQLVEAGESATRPTDPTREGNIFGGWFADADFAQRYVFDEVTENTTVYAKWGEHRVTWTVGEYSLQDVFTGNAPAADSNTTVNFAAEMNKPEGATLSWKTETDVSGDVTHTAQFSFPVTLNVNGGTINAGNVESYIYGTGAILPTDVTRAKYDFGGWYANSELTGTAVTQIGTTATGSKEFWAKWTAVYAVPATVTANNRTYDGTEKPLVTVTGTATGGVMQYALGDANGATGPYTTSIPAKTNAGTYYVWYKAVGDDNHNDTESDKVGVTISPAGVTLTANSATENYNGEEKTVTGYTSSVEGLTFADTVTAGGSGTDAGDYEVTFDGVTVNETKDTTGNYVVTETITGTLTISKKALTITAGSSAKNYDGTELTYGEYSASDLGTGDVLEAVTVTGGRTDVGSSDNVASAAVIKKGETDVTANYEITYVNGTLTVNRAADNNVTLSITGWTYGDDANAPTASAQFGTDTIVYTYSDAQDGEFTTEVPVNAGTWYVKASVAATDNYAAGEAVAEFEISKRDITITADSDTKVYDGTALTKDSYTNTDTAKGDRIDSVTVTGTQTDAGSSDNVASAAVIKKGETDVTANYEITYVNGTLTVTKATDNNVSVSITGWTYGDEANAPSITADFGADTVVFTYSDAEGGEFTTEVPVNAGTWYVKASVAATDNYAAGEAVAEFEIAAPGYRIIKGGDATWTKGTDGSISIEIVSSEEPDGSFARYKRTMDGDTEITAIVTLGSTIVTIAPEVLEKMTEGKHTIAVEFTNGSVSTTLTILPKQTSGDDTPATDTSENPIAAILLVVLFAGATMVFTRKRKRA